MALYILARRRQAAGYTVMALYSYGPMYLWPYIVTALCSYGPYSYGPIYLWAYIALAYTVVAYIAMAYTVMAYIVMALYSYGPI